MWHLFFNPDLLFIGPHVEPKVCGHPREQRGLVGDCVVGRANGYEPSVFGCARDFWPRKQLKVVHSR